MANHSKHNTKHSVGVAQCEYSVRSNLERRLIELRWRDA